MPQADMITSLEPNEVFVFGSNLAGRHGAGAALQARLQWKAQWGVGEGLTGQCYAFPTLDQDLDKLPLSHLTQSVTRLYETCQQHADRVFLLTKVGCGLAGYDESVIRQLFVHPPHNLLLPVDW